MLIIIYLHVKHLLIKLIKLLNILKKVFLLFFLLTSIISKSQLNWTPTDCIHVGDTITFSDPGGFGVGEINIPNSNSPQQLQFANGIFQYTPTTPGTYIVTGYWLSLGPVNTSFTVIDIPIELNLSNNNALICTGQTINLDSIGVNVSNNVGNISYNWTSTPPGTSWSGLIPYAIPVGLNSVTLTVTDDATGCTDSAIINLSYQNTSANASFVSSVNTITCPGESVTFTANNINTSLYSYSWEIDGYPVNGGNNGILNTNIFPVNNTVNVTLIVTELSNGCTDNESLTLNVNAPNYVVLDTTILFDAFGVPLSTGYYDNELNSFIYCEQDSATIDTLFNIFSGTSGIDTVIITSYMNNGFTQDTITQSQGFNEFYIELSESVYSIKFTTIYTGNCPPSEITYNILYNRNQSGFSSNFGQQFNQNLCKGDTVYYLIDPQIFNMPLNAEISFRIICDSINQDSVVWNYDSVINNTYNFDHDNNSLTPKIQTIVFGYVFNNSSCGCV